MTSDALTWKALSDPNRRRILDVLRKAPASTGDLCDLFPDVTRFAVMKHIAVLTEARLIIVKREGKVRWNSINPVPIRNIYERWVKKYEAGWSAQLLQLKNWTEHTTTHNLTRMKKERTLAQLANELEVEMKATPAQAWKALTTDVNKWWRKDFYTSPRTKKFIFEPKLGGRMYEDYGKDEGLTWYTVIAIDAPNMVLLQGLLSADYGGPAMTMVKICLEETKKKTTVLQLSEHVFGAISPELKGQLEAGWKMLFAEAMKSYVEKKK